MASDSVQIKKSSYYSHSLEKRVVMMQTRTAKESISQEFMTKNTIFF